MIGYKTDIGRVRDVNEDSYAVLNRHQLNDQFDLLAVVADGMGGGSGGDIASTIVAQTLPEAILEHLAERNGAAGATDPVILLRDLITRANTLVWMRQVENASLSGMGTTCVSLLVRENLLIVGNVGDSRAYLLRQGQLQQLTDDHSEVWEQVKQGNMTREQARRSSYRNVITRYIGSQANVIPDVIALPLEEGDTVLLCSDGLTTEINDNMIARILASVPDVQQVCDQLVTAALQAGGRDNITVVVLRYGVFTPLTLPEPAQSAQTAEVEDEELTDPDPPIRSRSRRHRRETVANAFEIVKEEPQEDTPEPQLRLPGYDTEVNEANEGRVGGALALVLIVLLTFLALGEGVALYITRNYRNVPLPKPDAATVSSISPIPVPRPLTYGPAKVILAEPALRNSPLSMDPNGDLYAFALNGNTLRITQGGKVTVLPGSIEPLDIPDRPKTRAFSSGMVVLRIDTRGNRFQTDLTNKCLQKFTRDGTRIVPNIGKDTLVAPGDFVVAPSGSIFIIDNHLLKKITATEAPVNAPDERDSSNAANPQPKPADTP